ncbi:alpha/beta hydrolase [Aureimonas sp. OT7]|uniref:alpha/beta hydrolase n=1 Tax=Aureimonas TaxID=414371 RepID=UPI00177E6615|nr:MULTISPECIES: alpha/beta hydrolase [Aureimonas]QOG07866.1 alpha/beta hydrolase [Aureimonas sp. OT7]
MSITRRFRAASFVAGIAVLLTGCASQVVDLITSRAGYSVSKDIPYGPDPRQTYDLYVPDGATARTPLVVFIHGGSWDTGSKTIYRFVGQALTAQGFVVAIPEYRLYPEVTFPAFVEDAAMAFAAIEDKARAGADGLPGGQHPMALMGHSAGAQIAALLAFDRSYLDAAGSSQERISAFVGLAGPYDFLPLTDERYKRIFPPSLRQRSQPVTYAGGTGPPTLLIHGTADRTVAADNSVSMARAIEDAGGQATLRLFDDVDHLGPISAFVTALPVGDKAIRETVFTFLRDHE